MSKYIEIDNLGKLKGAVIEYGENYTPSNGFSIDSRNISEGDIFIAIEGERFDGHEFVSQVAQKGAAAIIASSAKRDKLENISVTKVFVEDTTAALGELANMWREITGIRVVSLTGSSGKTTTKEILAAILSANYNTVKTEKNNNNHIGVPLTLLSCTPETEVAVLEHGTNHFGEIEYTANIAQPDYALITNIGDSHLEFFGNREGVLKEKKELFSAAVLNNGSLYFNTDDPLLKVLYSDTGYLKKTSFGFGSYSDIFGEITGYTAEGFPELTVTKEDTVMNFTSPLPGRINASNLLAAVAVAIDLDMSEEEIKRGLANLKSVSGRLQAEKLNGVLLINDYYNSNPDSLKAALELITGIEGYNRRVLVLGDMFELGDKSAEIHRSLAPEIKKSGAGTVLLTGGLMKNLYEGLSDAGVESFWFDKKENLEKHLQDTDYSGSVILVKGSRGMKMETAAEIIKGKYSK